MKIAVISLQEKIENPGSVSFEHLYERIGLNTGNLMFTNAVFRQLDGELHGIEFTFDPKEVNVKFDVVVIPAANWINAMSNWEWLCDLLEQVKIPVVTIGIGLQADNINEGAVQVNESSMRLIRILAGKSAYISTRGTFTRDWLYLQGIKNVIATGCPSLYLSFDFDEGGAFVDTKNEVVFQSTRFYAEESFNNSDNVNTRLFRLAYRYKAPIIFQSEAEEIRYLVYGSFSDKKELEVQKVSLLADLYGAETVDVLKEYLSSYGNVFFDIDMWSRFIRKYDCLIGARVHGAIVALLSGVRTVLITHDSRTQELADFSGIPHLSAADFLRHDFSRLEDLKSMIPDGGLERFRESRRRNAVIYRQFIESVGLSLRSDYEI